MRRPVTEVEWTRFGGFEGVAVLDDVREVEFSAAMNDCARGVGITRGDEERVAFDLRKERGVFQERDLDGFAEARAIDRIRKCREKVLIAEDREGHRERADEVLLAEAIDAVFHAHCSIVLREHCCGKSNETNAAMRDCRAETDGIKHRAATDGDDETLAANAVMLDEFDDAIDDVHVVFRSFTARHDDEINESRHMCGVRGEVLRDLRNERAVARAVHAFIDEDNRSTLNDAGVRRKDLAQGRIRNIERAARETHAVRKCEQHFAIARAGDGVEMGSDVVDEVVPRNSEEPQRRGVFQIQ